jgi:8-amino-7-oxononanoate synthase
MERLRKGLKDLEERGLYRRLRVLETSPEAETRLDGRVVVNFASNNYLGLAADERLKKAAREAVDRWGVGATASRLLGGSTELHDRLERELASFKGTEAAAVFPSGYHVNVGLLPALLEPPDVVVLDRYAHASLVDGARLSRATLRVFRHNDAADLEKVLRRLPAGRQAWIVTESVFSMDGDLAPLKDIAGLAHRCGARVFVDEAHATGVFGPEGRGLVNQLGLEKKIDVCMGTLSKALGSAGGFACGSRELIEWIRNRCRSFIYSTALPPPLAAAALAAIEICRTEPARREHLFDLSARLRNFLQSAVGHPESATVMGPIVPLIIGSEERALSLADHLAKAGFFAPAIRPPTVPKGTARLRFSLTSNHTRAHIDRLSETVSSFFQDEGLSLALKGRGWPKAG